MGGWVCDVAGWWRRGGKAACQNPSAQSSTHPPGGGVQSMDSGCEALSCGRGSSATPCGLSGDGVDLQGVSRGEKFRIGGAPPHISADCRNCVARPTARAPWRHRLQLHNKVTFFCFSFQKKKNPWRLMYARSRAPGWRGAPPWAAGRPRRGPRPGPGHPRQEPAPHGAAAAPKNTNTRLSRNSQRGILFQFNHASPHLSLILRT